MILGVVHTTSMIAGGLFPWLDVGALPLPPAFAWGAIAVMVAGFGLQTWSMLTLGPLFTLTLKTQDEHSIIERGPYRFVRHPGYLAQILFWLAFAAASRNALTLFVVATGVVVGYGYRMRSEERMLTRELGDRYLDYARRTPRLIPGLW